MQGSPRRPAGPFARALRLWRRPLSSGPGARQVVRPSELVSVAVSAASWGFPGSPRRASWASLAPSWARSWPGLVPGSCGSPRCVGRSGRCRLEERGGCANGSRRIGPGVSPLASAGYRPATALRRRSVVWRGIEPVASPAAPWPLLRPCGRPVELVEVRARGALPRKADGWSVGPPPRRRARLWIFGQVRVREPAIRPSGHKISPRKRGQKLAQRAFCPRRTHKREAEDLKHLFSSTTENKACVT